MDIESTKKLPKLTHMMRTLDNIGIMQTCKSHMLNMIKIMIELNIRIPINMYTPLKCLTRH